MVELFQPSTEAMAVIQWENNYTRWEARIAWKVSQNDMSAKLPTREKNADGKLKPGILWNAKYSRANKGQDRFASWKEEGVKKFQELTEEIKLARHDHADKIAKFEETFLAHLQKKHNVGDGAKKKRGKKRSIGGDVLEPASTKVNSMDLDTSMFLLD